MPRVEFKSESPVVRPDGTVDLRQVPVFGFFWKDGSSNAQASDEARQKLYNAEVRSAQGYLVTRPS